MGADVRDLLAAQYGKTSGMQAMRDYCETVYRAIAEYVLDADEDARRRPPAALTAENGRLCMAVNGGDSFDLLALLPQQYRGDVDAVEAELDGIIGLDEIKSYVRDIAKNVQAQQRRKAQGLKVAEVNMHDLYRQPRHRQDDDCPHTGQVPEGHRRTARRPVGRSHPCRPCGPLCGPHGTADELGHPERAGRRAVH